MTLRFEGTLTALVTPFKDDLSIDWDAFDRLVEGQIAGGVNGLVPCGTTGESPALDHEEQLELVRRCVKLAKGKASVVAGTGTNSTRSTIAASQAAARAGADAVMVVVPYYNKPTQDGLLHHYVNVAAAVDVPLVLYNVPGRTSIDLSADTLARICEKAPNVVAVKEATGNVLRAQEIVRTLGSRITVLSGDDMLMLPTVAVGGRGVISVTSNLYPAEVARATRLALESAGARGPESSEPLERGRSALTNDVSARDASSRDPRGEGAVGGRATFEDARREHLALCAVHEAMFVEANPVPVKAALAHHGRMTDLVRGPHVRISEPARAKVVAALKSYEAR